MSVFETEIRDAAYGGYGVGTMPDGRVIFVPHTVTGDRVKCRMTEDKKNFAYGEVAEITRLSPFRGEKYCPHIGACGGCVFGHIKQDEQVRIKTDFVTTQLKRQKIEFPEPEVFSADFREFRNRATFRIRDKKIGFFRFKSNDFIAVDDCPVIKHTMVDKAKALAAATDGGSYVLYVTENEKGEAIGSTDAKLSISCGFFGLETADRLFGGKSLRFETKYGDFFAGFSTFLQGNRHLSYRLQDFVRENATGNKALEFYCGAGFLTLALGAACRDVTATEISRESIALARKTPLRNVHWMAVSSETIITRLNGRFDTIVVDPPRTGLEKRVAGYIADSRAETVIYISCGPDTLSRDIARLSKNYSVEKMEIIDMFPGSYHVETAVLLKKRQ